MRISEVYTSTQGEGPRVGAPTQFVRFGGCNLRCPGWPCDTQHAIDPIYRHDWEIVTPEELYEGHLNQWPNNICFTGGEPFLQNKKELGIFTRQLVSAGYTVEAFTNGDIPWPTWMIPSNMDHDEHRKPIKVIMDWKLSGSGEASGTVARMNNFDRMDRYDVVKFTIKDDEDFDQAREIYRTHITPRPFAQRPQVYAGVVWGGKISDAELVEGILDSGLYWFLNVQVHKYVWPADARRV